MSKEILINQLFVGVKLYALIGLHTKYVIGKKEVSHA